jgi:hypothetical protein
MPDVHGTDPVSGGGPASGGGPVAAGRRREWLARIAGGTLVTMFALEAAVLECFLVPLRVAGWVMPISVLAAIVGNVLLARLMAGVVGRRLVALLPPLVWLVTVLTFAAPRAEGDLVVPGSWVGLAFLFLGTIAGAYGAATAPVPARRSPIRRATPDRGSPVVSG